MGRTGGCEDLTGLALVAGARDGILQRSRRAAARARSGAARDWDGPHPRLPLSLHQLLRSRRGHRRRGRDDDVPRGIDAVRAGSRCAVHALADLGRRARGAGGIGEVQRPHRARHRRGRPRLADAGTAESASHAAPRVDRPRVGAGRRVMEVRRQRAAIRQRAARQRIGRGRVRRGPRLLLGPLRLLVVSSAPDPGSERAGRATGRADDAAGLPQRLDDALRHGVGRLEFLLGAWTNRGPGRPVSVEAHSRHG